MTNNKIQLNEYELIDNIKLPITLESLEFQEKCFKRYVLKDITLITKAGVVDLKNKTIILDTGITRTYIILPKEEILRKNLKH